MRPAALADRSALDAAGLGQPHTRLRGGRTIGAGVVSKIVK